jgi:hypothetical protein
VELPDPGAPPAEVVGALEITVRLFEADAGLNDELGLREILRALAFPFDEIPGLIAKIDPGNELLRALLILSAFGLYLVTLFPILLVVGLASALALALVKGVLSLAAVFDADDLLGENTLRIDLDSSGLFRQDHAFRAAQSGANYEVDYQVLFR